MAGGNFAFNAVPNNTAASWWNDPGLRKLVFFMAICTISAVGSGVDGSLINGLQIIDSFMDNLGDISDNHLGLVIASFSLGALPALPISAYCMDRFGRRSSLLLGCISVIVGGIAQSFTYGANAFLGTRFVIGFGIALTGTSAPTLLMELAHPRMRGQASLLYNCSWYIGAAIIGWITYGTLVGMTGNWSWRLPCLLQITPEILLAVITVTLMPESPRWLVSKGRNEEALNTLAKYHANRDKEDALVNLEYAEIVEALEIEKTSQHGTSYLTLLKTPGNRHRLIICILVGFMCQWSGNGIVTYYLSPILTTAGVTSSATQALINVCMNIWNYPWAIAGALSANKLGRRPLFFISTGGMLICYIIITALAAEFTKTGKPAVGYAQIAFLFFFFASYDFGFTGLQSAYPIEVLPYSLRAKGYSITQFCIYLAMFFNQFVNPIGLSNISWKYYIVYDCILVLFLFLQWLLFPETKGRTLEEIREIFDKEPLSSMEGIGVNGSEILGDGGKAEEACIENIASRV
ncbi:hexose transporter [Cryptococcus neoformans]|nr:hexose transporter [Cryptococcus neoformans var. grubii]